MALIRPIHGEMSGSIAGNTWSHNKGGQYVRQRRTPINPNSVRQQSVRTSLSTQARAWNGLTTAQRSGWKTWATANPQLNRLGQSIKLTGISAFVKLSQTAVQAGNTAATTAPASVGPASLVAATMSANTSTTATLTFSTSPLPAGSKIQVWWTGAGRASQDPNFKQARLVGYTAAAVTSPITVTLPDTVATGAVTNFYLRVVDAVGRQSPPLKLRVTFA